MQARPALYARLGALLATLGADRWWAPAGAQTTAPPVAAPWHALTTEEVSARLDTGPLGLTSAELPARLARFGTNEVNPATPRTRLQLLASQFANLPTLLLIGSATASLLIGDVLDAGVILVVVGLNAFIGYRVERKNEVLLASWRRLEAGLARVIRGGTVVSISAADLVPGDVVLLRAGDVVPADVRVIDAHRLAAEEAPLTGESEPQQKHAEPVAQERPLAERRSMLYAGTVVASGRGRAIVVATGQSTELAGVRRLIEKSSDPETPLEQRWTSLAAGPPGSALAPPA